MANSIGTAWIQIKPSMSGISSSIAKDLGSANGEVEKSVNKGYTVAKNVLANLATNAIQGVISKTMQLGKEVINTGKDFEASMSQVAATLGYTVSELNDPTTEAAQNMEKLSSFAKEMGRTTAFSAVQASEALNYMALAGYDADTSISMLPAVLNLAAAGSIELGAASDMVTDAQTALGLSIEQTSTLVDEMARAASRSNTSVEQLGEAILTVGGTAQYMSGGTKELNTVLGILADNGIKGSEAGTHLRNMLLKLSSPTDDAKALLDELGVSVFDAEGQMRNFAEIFPDLNEAMADFTDEQKLQAFSTLFNTRDIASATALLTTTKERWSELGEEIGNAAGAAEAMAETQLDNLAGQITLLGSAWEGAKIALYEGDMTGFFDNLEEVFSRVGNIVTKAAPAVVDGIAGLVEVLSEQLPSLLMELIPVLVEGSSNIIQTLGNYLPNFVQSAINLLVSFVSAITPQLPAVLGALREGIMGAILNLTNPENLQRVLQAAIELFMAIVDAIPQALIELVNALPAIVTNILDFLMAPETIDAILNGAITALMALVDAIPQIITVLAEALPQILTKIIEFLTNPTNIGRLIGAAVTLFFSLVEAVPQILGALIGAFGTLVGNLWNGITHMFGEFAGNFGNFIGNIFKGAINGILTFIENLINGPIDVINGFISLINNAFGFIGVNLGTIPRIGLPRMAAGGVVGGVGTAFSDSNVVALSRGEYVIRAAAAREIGYDKLDRANETGRLGDGGVVTNITINGYNKDPNELAEIVSRKIALRTKGVLA